MRPCLRCDKRFASAGPENRLCQGCRETIGVSPTPEEPRRLPRVINLLGRGGPWGKP